MRIFFPYRYDFHGQGHKEELKEHLVKLIYFSLFSSLLNFQSFCAYSLDYLFVSQEELIKIWEQKIGKNPKNINNPECLFV